MAIEPDEEKLAEEAEDLGMVPVATVAKLAGVEVETVEKWIMEEPDFPRPHVRLSAGDLYDWATVYDWLLETGREGVVPIA